MAQQDNYIGIAFGLDVTDLKAGLQETKRSITTANKEFNNAIAGMDDWKSSSEGLGAKLKQLGTTLDMQERVVRGYRAELDKTIEKFGENSIQARNLRDKLLDAETAVKKTEKSIRYFNEELEKVERQEKDATDETKKLSRALGDLDNATVDVKGGFTVLKGAMANFVSTAVTSLISGLRSAVEESRELRKETSRLETAFIDNGFSSEQATASFIELNSVLGDTGRSTEALQLLSTMADSEDELTQYTDILTGVYGKFGDSLPVESLAEAMNHTAKLGEVQGTLADALEWVGINVDDFNAKLAECSGEEERAKLIRDTLNDVYSEASDTYKELNKDLIDSQKAETEYALAQADMGEQVEPILTSIKRGWTDILEAFTDMLKGMDLKGLQDGISDAFEYFVDEVVPIIKDAIQFVIKHKTIILSLITAIGAGFLAWKVASIIGGIVTAFRTWKTVTEGVTLAQKLLNTVMKANPIGLIITLIAGLVAGFITLWNTSDEFRNFWIGLWEKIKEVAGVVIDAIVKFFSSAWEWIKEAWAGAVEWFGNLWEGIKTTFASVGTWFSNLFTDAWNGIKNAWSSVTGWFSDVWNGIKTVFGTVKDTIGGFFSDAWDSITSVWDGVGDWFEEKVESIIGFFSELPEKMLTIGTDMIDGLKDGIDDALATAGDWFSGIGDNIVGGFKDVFNIQSPSRVMRDEIGMMLGAGIGEGILASRQVVLEDARRFTNDLTSELNELTAGLDANVTDIRKGGVTDIVNSAGKVAGTTNVVNNYNQVINAPTQPGRLEIYRRIQRETRNMLSASRGGY